MINPFKSKKGLGRGLSSLIGDSEKIDDKKNISISSLVRNKYQPRTIFDENKKYGYNPLINPYYNIISEAFEVNKLLKRIEENYKYSQKLIILDRDIIERNNKWKK